jgi:hypothetical protein
MPIEGFATETATTEGSGTLASSTATPYRIIADRERGSNRYAFTQSLEESILYGVSFERTMASRLTTVASAEISVIAGAATIEGAIVIDNLVMADLTIESAYAKIKINALQTDGNNRIVHLELRAELGERYACW